MRVLWIVNILFPFPSNVLKCTPSFSGGWLIAAAEELRRSNKVTLGVASVYEGRYLQQLSDGEINYFLLPGGARAMERYDRRLESVWKTVLEDFKPDLIHLHGTEFAHGFPILRVRNQIPVLVSLQGLLGPCAKRYFAGIRMRDILLNLTARDLLRRDCLIHQRNKFIRRSAYEREIIRQAALVLGRTAWDRANVSLIRPDARYVKCQELMRDAFFQKQWSIEKVQRNSIYVSQASYPIKGFHFLLEAASLLRSKYSRMKIYVAGPDVINRGFRLGGYGKYIRSLIRRRGLGETVSFLGLLRAEEVVERLVQVHTFVLPSAIENSPNSLAEAMLIGTPIVAAHVGGVPDMLTHGIDGLTYQYDDPTILAGYISMLWESDELAQRVSLSSRARARLEYDSKRNCKSLLEVYETEVSSSNSLGRNASGQD